MHKIKTYNYLKKYREQADFLLQDIAAIIGISDPALSKIEQGHIQPSIEVILAYHHILNIPITKLFQQHFKQSLSENLKRSKEHKEFLLDQKATSFIYKRLDMIEIILKRLHTIIKQYA